MNKKILLGSIALAPFLLITGCASNGPAANKPVGQDNPQEMTKSQSKIQQENDTATTSNKTSLNNMDKPTDNKPAVASTTDDKQYPLTDISETATIEKPDTLVFQFGFDKQGLTNEARAILMQHADYLSANKHLVLKVKGHTDARGPKAYNDMLSKERANSVASMLIEYGATPGQLQVIGRGDSEPLNDVDNFAENRRVELQYLDLQTADTDSDAQALLGKH